MKALCLAIAVACSIASDVTCRGGGGESSPCSPPAVSNYWAQQVFPNRATIGSAFSVSVPTADQQNIDHLKKAIKAEIGPKYPTLIAPDLIIYKPGEDKAVSKQSTLLESNKEETPYEFALPSKL